MNKDDINRVQVEKDLYIFHNITDKTSWFFAYVNANISNKYQRLRFMPEYVSRLEKLILAKDFVIGYDKNGNEIRTSIKDMTFPNGRNSIYYIIYCLEKLIKKNKGDTNTKMIYEELKYMLTVYVLNIENASENYQRVVGVRQNPTLRRYFDNINEDIEEFCLTEAGREVVDFAIKKNIIDKELRVKEGRLGDWISLINLKARESESIYGHILEMLEEQKIGNK